MASNDVRITESLRVKIGEAKNLLGGVSAKSTYCTLCLDREEIYRTALVDKCSNPFFGEEFYGEIPRQFRYLSCYVYEKPEKIIGKVSIRKRDLHKYHGKEHWFPILPPEASTEIQGKVHLEFRFEECFNGDANSSVSHRLAVRVVECNDLPVTNGACNPYAVVTFSYGKVRHREDVRRTAVKKKTICPQFEETFFFDLEDKGQNHDRNNYYIEDIFSGELRISLWHNDSRVSREVLGGMFPGVYLGEVKVPLRDLDTASPLNCWYFLRPNLGSKSAVNDLGSLRLKISYSTEHVFSTQHYDDLRNLILQSSEVKPVTSSAAVILGRVVDNLQNIAQPLVRVFLHHGKIVPIMEALAHYEIKNTQDPHTLFRGNTLLTKMADELMKLVGLPYLQHILKPTIQQICTEHLPCEIDPARIPDSENINTNLENLSGYIEQIFVAVTSSALICPTEMSKVFHVLKQVACQYFTEKSEVRYQVVSGFIFLRFIAPAILGPRFFELTEDSLDSGTSRTLTLISKAIQFLGNLVCAKSWSLNLKEDYMKPLLEQFSDETHTEAVKMFLDIISSSSKAALDGFHDSQEVPVVLKQGMLIKRAQGRKKFGVKNFKERYFCLTNGSLSYSKFKGGIPLCVISVEDILAVEHVEEQSFKMKYMFQVVQPSRALYVQASNCIEEKEWMDVLTKVSAANQNRLSLYHPAAYINGHWLCCKETDQSAKGCTEVSLSPLPNVKLDIDSDREIEKIHSLLLNNMDKLEAMQDACGALEVYSGNQFRVPVEIEDSKSCFEMLNEILRCVIGLEQEHLQYQKTVQKMHVKGSFESPIGDDSVLSTSPERDTKL